MPVRAGTGRRAGASGRFGALGRREIDMTKMFASLALLAALAALPSPSHAQFSDRVCVVADPTGTPLNVREEPNGRIVGTIANGVWVLVRTQTTVGGKSWAYIHDSNKFGTVGDPLGWVFDRYLKCL